MRWKSVLHVNFAVFYSEFRDIVSPSTNAENGHAYGTMLCPSVYCL